MKIVEKMSIEEDDKQFIIEHLLFNKGKCECSCWGSKCPFLNEEKYNNHERYNKKYKNIKLYCSLLTDEKIIEFTNKHGVGKVDWHRYENALSYAKIKKIKEIFQYK